MKILKEEAVLKKDRKNKENKKSGENREGGENKENEKTIYFVNLKKLALINKIKNWLPK